ncbi:hypothetical protein C8A00DRAFT_10855 [Chaetomidium leptoderma]|uniref:Uncharacterized protein n=1 Tax=Chaetomidium leptoderma TaxID=669021 RepID=A0AAN6VW16_9PEZI|nr:hypothetical protein C8A00DRAFT_10855 [Chaetomidium leptoderma]
MLSTNPDVPSPPVDLGSPSPAVPVRALQPQVAIPDHGYVSPRQKLDSRTPAPGSSSQPSPKQPQHGLNAPRPPLSPLSEYHSGFADDDLGPPPSLAHHRRQQSFPNLLPLAFKSRTPSPTRKTHTRSPSEQMPYTGEGRSNGRTAADSPRGAGGLASWLSGTAGAANALGLSPSTHGGANGASKDASPNITPTRPRRSTAGPVSTTPDVATPKSTTTAASRFMSALSSRFTPTTPTSPSLADTTTATNDELCTLNIEAALFPHHSPASPRDSFSPSAFKNLQMNATGLLTRMQTAYREQSAALRELQSERGAQQDELEEAVTRAEHLKLQLEGMARKAQEQEGEMKALVEALAAEKKKKRERSSRSSSRSRRGGAVVVVRTPPSEGAASSMVSEDLGVDEDRQGRRRRHRHRGGRGTGEEDGKSWKSSDDDEEEGETDEESAESESVFSRCRSPALRLSPPPPPPAVHTTVSDAGASAGTPHVRTSTGPGPVSAVPNRKSGPQMSAFQKILKGIAGEDSGCANCKGQDASVAWDTVGLLRDENRHLKTRVGELEVAVEGALDLVNGIGL